MGKHNVTRAEGLPSSSARTSLQSNFTFAAAKNLPTEKRGHFGYATALTLFERARDGDISAKAAISDAITKLGCALVSAVNLLSADCVVFSGGLSEQTELYLYLLIEFVKEHCYSSGSLPRFEKASLDELI